MQPLTVTVTRDETGNVDMNVQGMVTPAELLGLLEITKASILADLVKGPSKEPEPGLVLGNGNQGRLLRRGM